MVCIIQVADCDGRYLIELADGMIFTLENITHMHCYLMTTAASYTKLAYSTTLCRETPNDVRANFGDGQTYYSGKALMSLHALSKTLLCIVLAEPLFSFSPSLPHTWKIAEFFACLLGTVSLGPVDRKPLNRLALTENTCFLR
jgi:hypothetical protein